MAKKTTKKVSSAAPKAQATTGLQDHHKAFSHIMYALFLVSVTFAMFYTFNALGMLGDYRNSEYFYPVVAILMLLWAFLFWEFGHRIHTV